MPVYVIEFVTSDARPQQRRFTLDDDRPLRPQVEHVLAELERAGLVLRGGPADELTVRWAGDEVDATRSPAALGLTPDRAIELRMQRRRPQVTITAPPPPLPPEAPPERFVPRSVYASAALGAAGGWAAWTLAGVLPDGSMDAVDAAGVHLGPNVTFAALLGVCIGAAVGMGNARRTNRSAAGGLALGALLGFLGAVLPTLLALALEGARDPLDTAANAGLRLIALRALVWLALGAGIAAAIAPAVAGAHGARRGAAALRAGAWGAVVGLIGGALHAVPGPVELWSALGSGVLGAGVGAAVAWAAAHHAAAVLSLETRDPARGPGVLSLREWALREGARIAIPATADVVAPVVAVDGGVITQQRARDGVPHALRQDDRVTVGAARYRLRRRVVASALLLTGSGLVGVARSAPAQEPVAAPGASSRATVPDATREIVEPIDDVALVRCVADRPLPCVRVRVTLPPRAAVRDALEARGADAVDDTDSTSGAAGATGWSGRLGPYVLEPVQVRIARTGGPRRVVLTLIDVSGSMRGDGMQVARAAVRAFLRDLGVGAAPGAVQAALGAFASRGVASGVRNAAFAAPETVAGNVDLLPAPAGNTGLYSAVALGAERVAEAARATGEGTRAALIVITDGVNDVTDAAGRPRTDDDPGLLRGADGRAAAAARARQLGVDLYLVGVGQEPDMSELRGLAGDTQHAFRTARDAVALRAALARIDAALAPTRDVLFAVPGAERASLARPEWQLTVRRALGADTSAADFAQPWPAPLVGTPVFAGTAFRSDGRGPAPPTWLRTAAEDAPAFGRRTIVSAFVALLVAIIWAMPRALWRPVAAEDAAAAAPRGATPPMRGPLVSDAPVRQLPLRPVGGAVAGRADDVPIVANGLAPDVRDAPPRRPEDVTAQRVRRHGTRPASTVRAAAPTAPPRP